MTEEEQKEKEKIFLARGSILRWERPLKKGCISLLHMYDASTKLVGQIGLDLINEEVGPFKIVGSAAKYLADIVYLGKNWYRDGPVTGEVKQEILFSGGLAIYRKGEIPGTEIQGYDLERRGRVWIAKKPEEQFFNSDGLKNLVLGTTPDVVGRIEAILEGYQTQKDNERSAQRERERENLRRARWQGQEEGPVFRSGPC